MKKLSEQQELCGAGLVRPFRDKKPKPISKSKVPKPPKSAKKKKQKERKIHSSKPLRAEEPCPTTLKSNEEPLLPTSQGSSSDDNEVKRKRLRAQCLKKAGMIKKEEKQEAKREAKQEGSRAVAAASSELVKLKLELLFGSQDNQARADNSVEILPRIHECQNFRDFLTRFQRYYVDKTEWLGQVFKGKRIQLLTSPPKMGKSMLLSVAHLFFDHKTGEEEITRVFAALKISQLQEAWQLQRSFEVISLKMPASLHRAKDFSKWKDRIQDAFVQLYNSHDPSADTRELYHRRPGDLLLDLARRAEREVLILIDDYDAPLLAAARGGIIQEASSYYSEVLPASLLELPNVKKIVVAGSLKQELKGTFLDPALRQPRLRLNFLSLMRGSMDQGQAYLGFMAAEQASLLMKHKVTQDLINGATKFYTGFKIAREEVASPYEVQCALFFFQRGFHAKPQVFLYRELSLLQAYLEVAIGSSRPVIEAEGESASAIQQRFNKTVSKTETRFFPASDSESEDSDSSNSPSANPTQVESLLHLLLRILKGSFDFEYYETLSLIKLSEGPTSSASAISNLMLQLGLIKVSTSAEEDTSSCITTKPIRLQLLKLYLQTLGIFKSSESMIEFLRRGEFSTQISWRFFKEIKSSRLEQLKIEPEAYFFMLEALITHDNLDSIVFSIVELSPDFKQVFIVVDTLSSKSWVINVTHTRLKTQMHRLNYGFLNFAQQQSQLIERCAAVLGRTARIVLMGISFWNSDWLIDSIDRAMGLIRIEDKKNTVENDVVMKVKKGMRF